VRASLLLVLAALAGCRVSSTQSCEPVDGTVPVCGVQAPEDLAMVPWTRWLLLSQMPSAADPQAHPGGLAALQLETGEVLPLYPHEAADEPRPGWGDPACPGAPGRAFAPHGIDVEGSRLLVVNHGGREAVEWFEMEVAGAQPRVLWRGCTLAPGDASLNDVAALPRGGFAATKMLERTSGWGLGTVFAMLAGRNTGHVLTWSPESGWQKVPDSDGRAPNGIAAAGEGQLIFYSEFMGGRITRIGRDGSRKQSVAVDFKPDNLTWTSRGTLLAAGATGSLLEIMGCGQVRAGACQAGFAVAEIDPRTLAAHEILRSDGKAGGGVSVALDLGGTLHLGAFAGDRLLRVKPQAPAN
jgi:hypothetical protein